MIGILFLFSATSGIFLSGLLAWFAISVQRKAVAAGESGWWLFTAVAVTAALIVIAVGCFHLLAARHSPPRAEDYSIVMRALFLFGISPGIGLLAGCVPTMFRSVF